MKIYIRGYSIIVQVIKNKNLHVLDTIKKVSRGHELKRKQRWLCERSWREDRAGEMI